MAKTRYFYDSYAIIAYLSDNPAYRAYFEENDGVLTKLNLIEVCYRTMQMHGQEAAEDVVKSLASYVIDFSQSDIVASMKLRLTLKNDGLNVSYTDALGYYLALKNKLKFLTGDKAFESLDSVEYVK